MRPLQPRLGKAQARLVVAAVWIGALATAAPIPIVSQLQKPSPWHVACDVDLCQEHWPSGELSEQFTCALLVLQFALPLCALIWTYARIAHVVWGGRCPGEAQSVRDSRLQNSKRKMVKMMVTVVAVFTICWLPLNIFIVLWTTHEEDEEWSSWPGMPYAFFASHWLAMSHCCYNPIIYGYMNARYRRGFKQILGGIFCTKIPDLSHSTQRLSICEGVPLSDMGNMSTMPRRLTACTCRKNYSFAGNCCMCPSVRQVRLQPSPPPPAQTDVSDAPVRAHSVRSNFTY